MLGLLNYWKAIPAIVLVVIVWFYFIHIPSEYKKAKLDDILQDALMEEKVKMQEKEAFKVKRRLDEVTDDSCESNCTSWL